ncbi:hypothetical protein HYV86_06050 [Candidatus Woesearchaeota archaeon]|nr:hypothetical protein [Candidatus Woesearchaeota archaeon]
MNKKTLAIIGIVALLVLIGLAIWFFAPSRDLSPTGGVVADLPVPSEPKEEPRIFEPQSQDHRVEILGKEGYDVTDLTIRKDDAVVWFNNDPTEKRMVITIKSMDNVDALIAGKLFAYGEEWTHTFTQAGEYQFWTEAYGKKGTITVEE